MSDLLLDKDGDICTSNFGDLLCCNDDMDIIQQANNMIMMKIGENPFHFNLGNASLSDRMKFKGSYLDKIETDCISAIELGDDRVDSVDELTATLSDTYGEVNISYTLTTIGGNVLNSSCIMRL